MATYNGEKYIKKQLESILIQLEKNDEIVLEKIKLDNNNFALKLHLYKKYLQILDKLKKLRDNSKSFEEYVKYEFEIEIICSKQNIVKKLDFQHRLQLPKDLINESRVKAEEIISEAKKSAEEEAKNTVFDAEDKAKEEAKSIAASSENDVKSLKDAAMANVDEAASIIVKNIL